MDKQYLKSVLGYIASGLISVMFIAYVLYHMLNSLDSDIKTIQLDTVTVDDNVTVDAYILRDESVLFSSVDGAVNYLYNDGDKVRNSSAVLNVYSGGSSSETRAKLMEIDRKLEVYRNSSVDGVSVTDTTAIDKQIDELHSLMIKKADEGDIDYVIRRRDDLLTLLNRRNLITNVVSGYESEIAGLEQQKTALTSALSAITQTVTTAKPGYFYSTIDGYEQIFSSTLVDDLTYSDFIAMTDASPDQNLIQSGTNYGVGKLVNSYVWYIACELDTSSLSELSADSDYEIIFPYNNDISIDMSLFRIIKNSTGDRTVLIFKTGIMPEGFSYIRRQAIEIVQKSFTGYRIPTSAVRMVDGVQGVYILSGNVIEFREIENLTEIDGYFIVKEQDSVNDEKYMDKLGPYDIVITEGKNLYEGKIID